MDIQIIFSSANFLILSLVIFLILRLLLRPFLKSLIEDHKVEKILEMFNEEDKER